VTIKLPGHLPALAANASRAAKYVQSLPPKERETLEKLLVHYSNAFRDQDEANRKIVAALEELVKINNASSAGGTESLLLALMFGGS
jgi:negative regulator of replication initiation